MGGIFVCIEQVMQKFLIAFYFVFVQSTLFSQVIVKPSEKLIYSFETKNKRLVLIALDTVHYKVIYRYGTGTNTELEIIHDTASGLYSYDDTSKFWNTFSYSFYLRGGGAMNDGLDFNYFQFVNKGFLYVLYSEYSATDDHTDIGIRVTNLETKNEVNIKGELKTQKGSLADFRYGKLVIETEGQL
jgi:hypothetical protein